MSLVPGTPARAPGSFSALPPPSPRTQTPSQASQLRLVESSDESDSEDAQSISVTKRSQNAQAQQRPSNIFAVSNSSSTSLQNFSRPTAQHSRPSGDSLRTASPLTLPPQTSNVDFRTHTRKHSNSAGYFEPSVPATANIHPSIGSTGVVMAGPNSNLSASQIAAQAAMQHQQHSRQRSQTLPLDNNFGGPRRPSRGPVSPPLLSLTEASGERQSGFGNVGQQEYRNGLLGGGTSAATTAANVVFPRSPQSSPG
jgi:hypothetical protein